MSLKLKEWNELLDYANATCQDLQCKGYNVDCEAYSVYDGRQGISLRVFDNLGRTFKKYNSGIYNDLNIMKANIKNNANRILIEC